MKQKNMALVAVAVVCGLVAAFLTSQMGAKGRTKVEEIPVVVAAKEIPIGTRIPAEEVAKWVKIKNYPKDAAPVSLVPAIEEVSGKFIMNRTYRENEPLSPLDVSATGMMSPPEGYGMMSLPIQPDAAVSGFIRPGTRVDVWCSVMKKKNSQWVAFPMFLDMLVLAVNQDATGPQGNSAAYTGVSMVSMAVQPEHTELFQLAISRGAQLRLVMRHPEAGKASMYSKIPTVKEIREILIDKEAEIKPAPLPPPVEMVKIKIAIKDIAAKTKVTQELIDSAFRDQEVARDQVPMNAVRNIGDHIGEFFAKELAENQFVPQNYLIAKLVEPAPMPTPAPVTPPKAAPGPDDKPGEKAPPEALPEVKPTKPKPEYVYLSMSGASGIVWTRFQKLPNGELKKIGIIKPGEDEDFPDAKQPQSPKAEEGSKSEDGKGRTL